MQGSVVTRSVRVAAEPYQDPERQRVVFGRRLASAVVPLLLVVRNEGDQPLRLRRGDLSLRTDDETVAAEGWGEARATLLDLGRDIVDSVGFASDARYHQLSFRLSDLFGLGRRQPADFGAWDLPTRAGIEPGQTVRGFVYFVRAAPPTNQEEGFVLLVPLGSDDAASGTETLEVPLRSRLPLPE